MFISLLCAFFFVSVFSQESTKESKRKKSSFTFINKNKEYSLSPYINSEKNIIRRFSRRIMGYDENPDVSAWYYVHFLTSDLHEISKTLNFTIKSSILKDTFILYLRTSQLEKIQNISLVRKLESSDKFYEGGGSIEKVNLFHVVVAPGFNLPLNPDLYTILRRDDQDSFLIQVNRNELSKKKFTQKKKKVVKELSSIDSVKSVSTFTRPRVKNNLMTGYTQKNAPISSRLTHKSGVYYLPRYVNDKGINGEGQIITIQDTPIDPYHAMFRDDTYGSIKLNQELTNHRKFVYYGHISNDLNNLSRTIEENEHGTHVAGTTAGKSICTNDDEKGTSLYNGNAPESKILYAGGLNDVTADELGTLMKKYGSYISTNSWGVDGYYDRINYQYGKLAYENPQRLFLFAAGNEYEDGNFTVCDPGGSKNVLTVGAIGDFLGDSRYQIESVNNPSISFTVYALLDADPWTIGSISTKKGSKVLAIDSSAGSQCNSINGNHISLLYASSSSQLDWIFSCELGETSGILYTYETSDVSKLLSAGGNVKVTDITQFNNSKPITHADYSSGGPGNKGILKPDIMAPGTHITSAKSRAGVTQDHGCRDQNEADFTYMQGTSMATPNAAGAVALVRQYFIDGKWLNTPVTLNAATMRALMINSCKHPHTNKRTPDVLFGHGVVDLSTILPFDNSFGVQITNQDKSPSISEEGHLVAKVEVKSKNVDLQITMSYLDPMLEASSNVPLTRDLDLVVMSPSNKRYLGDHLDTGDSQHFSTNEKVVIWKNEVEIGNYTIHIQSGDFMDGGLGTDKQDFSVVVTGDIENKTIVFGKPSSGTGGDTGGGTGGDTGGGTGDGDEDVYIPIDSCPCDQCADRDLTQCKCDENHIGSLCQAEVITVHGTSGSYNVESLEVKRIMFITDIEIRTIKAKASGGSFTDKATLWFSDQCHVSINDYENSAEAGHFLSKSITVDPAKSSICIAIFNNNAESATYQIEVSDKKSYTNIIIGSVVGGVAVIVIGVVSYCLCKKGKCSCCSKLPVVGSSGQGD